MSRATEQVSLEQREDKGGEGEGGRRGETEKVAGEGGWRRRGS